MSVSVEHFPKWLYKSAPNNGELPDAFVNRLQFLEVL